VAKGDHGADLEQPLGLGCGCRRGADPKSVGRVPQQHRIADWLRRRDKQQPLGLDREALDPSPETVLDARHEPMRLRRPKTAGRLGRRQPSRQLMERQRVAARLGEDPVADPLVHWPGDHRVQQRPRVALTQTFDRQLGQPPEALGVLARREHQPQRLR
jgi:hypothetical protein